MMTLRRREARPHVSGPVILSYHRIALPQTDPWSISVSPRNFADQIQALQQSRRIVSLQQLVNDLEQHRLTDDAVAITFDDGYSDNFHTAEPLLERFSAPATFFLATGYIGRQEFWWDELERLVLRAVDLSPEMLRKNFSLELDDVGADERSGLGQRVRVAWRYLRGPRHDQRMRLLLAIWRRLRPLSVCPDSAQ